MFKHAGRIIRQRSIPPQQPCRPPAGSTVNYALHASPSAPRWQSSSSSSATNPGRLHAETTKLHSMISSLLGTPTSPRSPTTSELQAVHSRLSSLLRSTAPSPPRQKLGFAAPKNTKRRQAAASQDLRDNPPPTRGPVLECISYSTAERYDLAALGVNLRACGIPFNLAPEGNNEDQAIVISLSSESSDEHAVDASNTSFWLQSFSQPPSSSSSPSSSSNRPSSNAFGQGQTGEIWVFKSGSFVTWGLSRVQGAAFLRHVVRMGGRGGGRVETGRYEDIQTEEVDFVVDPTKETLIKGDLIILGSPPTLTTFPPNPSYALLLTRYTLSLALARSSALSAIEAKLDAHLSSVSKLPKMLAVSGKQPLRRGMVIRKIGELMMLREAVNFRGGGLEDTPEIYWSEPELEAYFDSVSTEFELKERIDAVNQKVDYANEVQSTLRALLTEASGHRMELIIIALIAVEVCIVLIREGPELYHKVASWFFDLEDEDHPDSMSFSTRPIESVENRVSCPGDRPMDASAADRRLV